ncbi:YihY/virulence factor BrkB family protein [Cesiribacter sp. SM1]|uniref:YihY/virulence factor BrkB family protein n=1 Tax=Cesiribacter sp. SM1 TaxID=2861196 RepID=UPI001CD3A1A7|nr:YihY/virulence factor BrkB family protein [Cesiribacter sp. SM1]
MKRIKRRAVTVWSVLVATYTKWMENDPFRLSAVIAYYTVFSMPGLFVVIFYVTGQFFSGVTVRGQVYRELSDILGSEGARQVEDTILAASEAQRSTIATIIGIASLVYAATGVFFHLKISLNDIWELKVIPERAFKQLILDRLFAFGMVLVVGFLLLTSLIVSSVVTAISGYMTEHIDVYSSYSTYIIDVVNFVISVTVITLLFATIYKVLPDANVSWSDVWIGAFVTSVLFLLGKALIARYIGITDPASAYGAASSIILILLWTSYASLIFFLGAAFTAVWAKRYGHRIEPKHYAVPVYEYYRRISQKGEAEYVKVQSDKVKEVLDKDYETPRLTDEGEKPPLKVDKTIDDEEDGEVKDKNRKR